VPYREHLAGEPGYRVEQPFEVGLAEHDQINIGVGDDSRIAGSLFEERDFTEAVARSESRNFAALGG
jgi:hypothetical protein